MWVLCKVEKCRKPENRKKTCNTFSGFYRLKNISVFSCNGIPRSAFRFTFRLTCTMTLRDMIMDMIMNDSFANQKTKTSPIAAVIPYLRTLNIQLVEGEQSFH